MPASASAHRKLVFALGVVALLLALPAAACTVCVDLPERTVTDRLLGDRLVVVARPAPDNIYRYETVEMLTGRPADLARLPEIPFLVDSTARQKIKAGKAHHVLVSYGPTGPDENGMLGEDAWHLLMTLRPERRHMVDLILAEGSGWDRGMDRGPDRFAFFAARHADPDPAVQRVALAEIERSPYAQIRTIKHGLPVAELKRRLVDKNQLAFSAIYILLLGASDDPVADDHVRNGFASALNLGGRLLPAWAVAGIEVGGAGALNQAADALLSGSMNAKDRLGIIEALTVTGRARPELRHDILPVLHDAARRFPEHAAEVANTLHEWRDWTLAPYFAELLKSEREFDPASRFVLQIIVSAGQDEAS